MKLPSISVIFLSYKQKDYVLTALRAVLAQDLDDYEVIIGDDASPDNTRKIIETELASYRGTARITLLPPGVNVGVIRNFNQCVAVATGDIIVAAAGDDISHPSRLRKIAEFFRDSPQCFAHYSNARIIDAEGCVTRPSWYHHNGLLLKNFNFKNTNLYQGVQFCGATASYRAEIFRKFPPLRGTTGGEDGPAVLRALMMGTVALDSETMLDWRWHGSNMSHGSRPKNLNWRDKLRRMAAWPAGQKPHRRGYLADLEYAEREGMVDPAILKRLRQLVDDLHAQASVKLHCIHPTARWAAIAMSVRRFWKVSPRSFFWKVRFITKAVSKKLMPGPLRAAILFNFSKF
jgi:glycosyltransferase involved in cell wall biosynthesis